MDSFRPDDIAVPNGHFIGGALVDAGGDDRAVLRPSDGRVYAAFRAADADLVSSAVERADAAFRQSPWARCAPRARTRTLCRLADLIEENAAALARLEAVGSTRPVAQCAAWDMPYLAELFRYYAELCDKDGGAVAPTAASKLGFTIQEPIGVVAAIAPWNFPLVMAATKVAPVLAAGNAVVLKPSELTPFSVLRLAELARRAGIPDGIFNVVLGDGPVTGAALVAHPLVGKVTFTGSTRTGARIMAAAAMQGPKPVTLELGGKSPQIVFADADLEPTAAAIAGSVLGNAGQVCVAGTRLLVQRRIADRFVDALVRRMRAIRPGATWDSAGDYAPIVSSAQLGQVSALVESGLRAGGETLLGAARIDRPGFFYAPTLVRIGDGGNPLARREVFGPVATLQVFDAEEEAVAMANDCDYGLAAGVHTADLSVALRCVRAIDAGTVWVNRYGRSNDFSMCTGGFKKSGIGKDLGREAFEASRRTKSVLLEF